MGSFDDVVLAYQHPYIATFLEDNTIYVDEEEAAVPNPSFNGIQVGFFEKGRDNVMLYSRNTQMFLREHGKPNYKLYGQAAYNVVNALDTNQCGMYTLRLLPEDATYANAVIMAYWKESTVTTEEEDPGEEGAAAKPQLFVKFTKKTIEGATTLSKLKTGVAALYGSAVDAAGYNYAPLFSVWQLGRGEYGNSTKIKFVDSMEYDTDVENYRHYQISVMEPGATGLSTVGTSDGTLCDGVLDMNVSNLSMFLDDIVNDPETGSDKINVMVHTDTFEKLVEAYNTTYETNYATDEENTIPKLTDKQVDFIFGLMMDGSENGVINMVDNTTEDGYVNLASIDGFALESGSEGSLEGEAGAVEQVKKDLLIKAFQGNIDRKLVSRFGTPADFCMDANFPEEVKRELGGFAARREYDAMTYIDSGLITTNSELLDFLQGMNGITAYNLVKECGCYNYRDTTYTGKRIDMTITHWLCKALPKHISIEAYTTPFAREDARLVAGVDFVSGTFFPQINPDDHEVKKNIYKYGANCYETVSTGVIQRSTAITTCVENSDRRLEFNEYILHRAVKIAYDILESKLYKIGEEEQRLQYQKHAEKEISYQLAAYLRTVNVQFVMTAKDERRSIMRLRMRLVFKTVITRGILEIYLDPRTGTVTEAEVLSSSATPV